MNQKSDEFINRAKLFFLDSNESVKSVHSKLILRKKYREGSTVFCDWQLVVSSSEGEHDSFAIVD